MTHQRDEETTGNSNWQGDAYIIDLVHLYRPKIVLDLGVGKWGKMGYLLRRSYDEWNGIQYGTAPIKIVGVEGFKPNADYVAKNFANLYDIILPWDILDFVYTHLETSEIDVAILGDVLEHFTMETALNIIKRLNEYVKKAIIIQLPLNEYGQHLELNPLENHRSTWTALEIQKLRPAGLRKFTDFSGRDFVVFSIPK